MSSLLINNIKQLLQIEKIKKKERKDRGELFNVFSTMRMETDEVYTHSAIIAELLNPRGSHGSGDLYLNLFLQSISDLQDIQFDTTHAKVDVEYYIGPISKDYTQGGRIDIIVQSEKRALIIENKINAGDQPKQLYRYKNFACSQNYLDYHILYLTKEGKNASKDSLYTMSTDDYVKISYQSTIRDWLSLCIEKSANKPLVRETLVQYQNLVLKLTHQDMEESTKQGIIDLCKEADNVEAMLWIHQHFDSIMNDILCNVFQPQLNNLAERYSLKLKVKGEGKDWLNTPYMSFSFLRPERWQTFEISFEFQSKGLGSLGCGFRYIDVNNRGLKSDLYNQLASMYEGKQTLRWPSFRDCKGYSNWQKRNIISSMYDGSLIVKIEEDLTRLLQAESQISL